MTTEYPLVLRGAYGRVYNGEEDALADYKAGKDFQLIFTGQYCSCRDFVGEKVTIRTKSGYYEVTI